MFVQVNTHVNSRAQTRGSHPPEVLGLASGGAVAVLPATQDALQDGQVLLPLLFQGRGSFYHSLIFLCITENENQIKIFPMLLQQ